MPHSLEQGNASQTSPVLKSGKYENKTGNEQRLVVKITEADIEDEVEFWNTTIMCYLLGANPPITVMEGFFRRIWQGKVDWVGMPKHGIFIVRFNSMEMKAEVLKAGYVFF